MENRPVGNASNAPSSSSVDKLVVGQIVFVWHDGMLYEAHVDQEHRTVLENGSTRIVAYTVTLQTWRRMVQKTVKPEAAIPIDDASIRYVHSLMRKKSDKPLALRPFPPQIDLSQMQSPNEIQDLQMKMPPSTGGDDAKFRFPPVLQMLLLEDWEKVTKEYHLMGLPCVVTVRDILQRWGNRRKGDQDDNGGASCDLLLYYFDAALPKMLLYHFEVPQYVQDFDRAGARANSKPSGRYGGFHLLRFLVKLPFLLEALNVPELQMSDISSTINDLSNYLVRNGRIIFSQMHQPASQAYISKVAVFTSDNEK